LNLGVSGYVSDQISLDAMKANNKIGDIIDLVVAEPFDSSETHLYDSTLI